MLAQLAPRTRGYLAILAGTVLFGSWASVGKIVVSGLHPVTAAIYLQFVSGLALLPTVRRRDLPRGQMRLFVPTTLAGAVVAPILYFDGLQRTQATNAALLQNTEALFTILFAFVFLGERLPRRGYAALASIAVGAFLVTTELRFGDVQFFEFLLGNLLLIGAACGWGIDNTGTTVLTHRLRLLPLISLKILAGNLVLLPIVTAAGIPLAVPLEALPGLVFMGLVGIVLFTVLFYYALRTIGGMRAGSVLSTSPFWGILFAVLLFPGSTLSVWQIVGGTLMAGSLLALYAFADRGSASPAETLKAAPPDGPDSP
ncbi:MAG: hypothetical protein A3K68_02445 [Euryarchaeota archaeon RBG_16_68_13]|nr:MAG: hypothetical protein A3K68_02445 [Euryarchaeota archaeon RBG_16_68_13]